MSFHMSQFQSSGSAVTLTTKPEYRHFANPAEFDRYVAERGKKNEEGLRALGVPIIDFNVCRLFLGPSFCLILLPISALYAPKASVYCVRLHAVPQRTSLS
jgi:hypothetical protein